LGADQGNEGRLQVTENGENGTKHVMELPNPSQTQDKLYRIVIFFGKTIAIRIQLMRYYAPLKLMRDSSLIPPARRAVDYAMSTGGDLQRSIEQRLDWQPQLPPPAANRWKRTSKSDPAILRADRDCQDRSRFQHPSKA
jgi:hypothetical protein